MSYETIKADVFEAFRTSDDAKSYGLTPSRRAVGDFVDNCLQNKSKLIEMLRKYPNWDEENMRIYLDAQFSREVNHTMASDALYAISYQLRVYAPVGSDLFNLGEKLRLTRSQLSGANSVPEGLTDYYRITVPALPEARIKDFSKCTRSVMKMLDQYHYESLGPDVKRAIDQQFAIYTDAMNELKVTKGTVVSVNPVDFLQMSWGNSWDSCHSISYGGGWQAGCLSYALDEVSMILYTVPLGTPKEELSTIKRETREVFFWNGEILVGSRCYPAVDDTSRPIYRDNRAVVENIISTCLDIPDQWSKYGWSYTRASANSSRFQYPDYYHHHYDGYRNDFLPEPIHTVFDIGVDEVPCVACDDGEKIGFSNRLFGGHCERYAVHTCDLCGEDIDDGDEYYVNGEDEYVCGYCWDNEVHACEYDGHDYYERHMTYLDGVGWVHDDNVYHYRRCPECRDFFFEDDMYYDEETDEYYCEYCYDDLIAAREAEVEEVTAAIEVLMDACEMIEGGM